MLMGKLLSNTNYPIYDYGVAFVVGLGIAMFMSTSEDVAYNESDLSSGDPTLPLSPVLQNSSMVTGIALLFLFLLGIRTS